MAAEAAAKAVVNTAAHGRSRLLRRRRRRAKRANGMDDAEDGDAAIALLPVTTV